MSGQQGFVATDATPPMPPGTIELDWLRDGPIILDEEATARLEEIMRHPAPPLPIQPLDLRAFDDD